MPASDSWSPFSQCCDSFSFSGALPEKLYRYRQLGDDWIEKRLVDEVLDETIFLAAADALNDPDEGRVRWAAEGPLDVAIGVVYKSLLAQRGNKNPADLLLEAIEIAKRMVGDPRVPLQTVQQLHSFLGKLVRVACFTTRPLNGPMWTHYGNYRGQDGRVTYHGGLCIEYGVDESWRGAGLRPVEYVEDRPEINMLARDSLEAQFAHATKIKSPDWAYEDEWRLVAYLNATPPFSSNFDVNSKLKLEGSVRSVIFGLNAKEFVVERITKTIRDRWSSVALKRVARDEATAALTIVSI